jgi:hypothetical protein
MGLSPAPRMRARTSAQVEQTMTKLSAYEAQVPSEIQRERGFRRDETSGSVHRGDEKGYGLISESPPHFECTRLSGVVAWPSRPNGQ